MKNARRYDSRITVGAVPDSEDLQQLERLGYKTLIDLRDDDERFGGLVEKRARDLGLAYIGIPVVRDEITIEQVLSFYQCAYRRGAAPLYCFSRYGKRPLALLLLLDAVAQQKPLTYIFRRAAKFGMNLEGDLALHAFLTDFYNSGKIEPIVAAIRELRPDLV